MHRNLDRRVEALVRLTDPRHLADLESLMERGMSDEYSHWKLGDDGRWMRHHLDDDGEPLHRPAGRPDRDARQAAPQGPPPVTAAGTRARDGD